MKVNVVQNVLQANDLVANKNREVFKKHQALAVNLISSPGSGKTTLLEKTIPALGPDQKSIVIVGDLQTTRDADRLSDKAYQVTQVNTGLSCHLYANQIAQSLETLKINEADYLFIDDEGLNYFSWRPQAEIHLDAAGFGLYYSTVIKFKKKTYVHAAARLKAFGTICKILGKNHTLTTLREFVVLPKTHKKCPVKFRKFLQHRFSGPGSNSNARLKVLYEEVKHLR
jgi:hypothetical protein